MNQKTSNQSKSIIGLRVCVLDSVSGLIASNITLSGYRAIKYVLGFKQHLTYIEVQSLCTQVFSKFDVCHYPTCDLNHNRMIPMDIMKRSPWDSSLIKMINR